MTLNHEDLIVECVDDRHGGMTVGVSNKIKVTHIPTGTIAVVSIGRSQYKNREIAMEMIEWAISSG